MLNRRDFLKVTGVAAAAAAFSQMKGTVPVEAAVMAPPGQVKTPVQAIAVTVPQTPLSGAALQAAGLQFVDPLPGLYTIVAGPNRIELQMKEFQTRVMPTGFNPATFGGSGAYTGTWTWGYLKTGQTNPQSNIGPVIVATRGTPTEIKFINNLGSTTGSRVLAYKNGTDQTIMWADPLHDGANTLAMDAFLNPGVLPAPAGQLNYAGTIPACPHLHGGEVPPVVDGGPETWFTADGHHVGKTFYSKDGSTPRNYEILRYPNDQSAAPLWFHDHTMGATRLNVYCGLAGAYILVDPNLQLPPNLPGPADIIPVVIQDRMFDVNGQLFFPSDTLGGTQSALNPQHPFWVPEFLGDVIMVNGKVWPYKSLDARRYRFLFLEGSNARSYHLFMGGAHHPMWVIGTDDGYLDSPVQVNELTIMPGERYEVIIDFSDLAGQNVVLMNDALSPLGPDGDPVEPTTNGSIMQFRVSPGAVVDTSYDPATYGFIRTSPAQRIVRLVDNATGSPAPGIVIARKRQLTLNEIAHDDPYPGPIGGIVWPTGPVEILVNNTKYDGMRVKTTGGQEPVPGSVDDGFGNMLTELPKEGDTELWEIINLTEDAHPIHTHLTSFQLMNRQDFDKDDYIEAYNALFPASVQIDPNTLAPYAGGEIIDGFGPPNPYNTPNADGALGGNPAMGGFLSGPAVPALPEERGWKDTVRTWPGQVTRFLVRFAPNDLASLNPGAANFYLHGANALNNTAPVALTPISKDAPVIARTTFMEIGTWQETLTGPLDLSQASSNVLHVWLGLKNSDDNGTVFDVKAEILKNGVVLASSVLSNILGVTRVNNDNTLSQMKQVAVAFGPITGATFVATNTLGIKISAKVASTGGHSSATGLRLYYDAATVDSRLDEGLDFPFDPAALGHGFVWHCHIVDHEDNEMMRPHKILPNPSAHRSYVQGVDY